MQVFLVGGAVRDELLGVPFHERDWVITGATPEALIQLGYQQVGNDFPVFCIPKRGKNTPSLELNASKGWATPDLFAMHRLASV